MARKNINSFFCTECGSAFSKWSGKCAACNAWNTIMEEPLTGPESIKQLSSPLEALSSKIDLEERIITPSYELNLVLGGGIVIGSSVLIGGEPGIGKSTLLLDLSAKLATPGRKVIYASGEESLNQIRLRARRMGIEKSLVNLSSENQVGALTSLIGSLKRGDVLIVDSIQTVYIEGLGSPPGSVTQVRTCTNELLKYARLHEICLFLVGHINKEGQIAGPKVLEHMVDVVLYFEEDTSHIFRILRNIKNRFGNVRESGIYRMSESGLVEISNPSNIFLSNNNIIEEKIGSVIYAGLEGTRPVMLEVQSLLAPSFLAFPKRAVIGWDTNRLSMIIAVLSTHLKMKLQEKEIYLNIVGGLKLEDSSLDFAVALSLFSSFFEIPVKKNLAAFGEIGLSGELRGTAFMESRIKEALRLGYTEILCPPLLPEHRSLLSNKGLVEVKNVTFLKYILQPVKKISG